MKLIILLFILIKILFIPIGYACDQVNIIVADEELNFICQETIEEQYLVNDYENSHNLIEFNSSFYGRTYLGWEEDKKIIDENYWSDWAFVDDTYSVLTGQLSNNFFGLGMWLPEDIQEDAPTLDYMEWLMSHGLQFSFAFGESKGKTPRMRIDYRWHQTFDNNVILQLEVPF